jgi:hypothetical protein
MILLYRITPFFVGLVSLLGFLGLMHAWTYPLIVIVISLILFMALFARLLKWQFNTFSFWFFLGTPSLFFAASFSVFLLAEDSLSRALIALLSVSLLVLFTEYVFQYIHLPSKYQPFSLEYLTLILNVLSVFFFSSLGFAARILLQSPLALLAVCVFALMYFLVYGTLWVSKAETFRSHYYSVFGSILLTEFFIVLTFLPPGFYTNAAFLTVFAYLFLGLTRAHAIHKLSKEMMIRYTVTSVILLVFIGLSSQWL